MTKKIIAVLLALAMVFTFVACGVDANQVYEIVITEDQPAEKIKAYGTVNMPTGNKNVVTLQGTLLPGTNEDEYNYSNKFSKNGLVYSYIVVGNGITEGYKTYLTQSKGYYDILSTDRIKEDFKAVFDKFLGKYSEVFNSLGLKFAIYSNEEQYDTATNYFMILEYKLGAAEYVVIVPDLVEGLDALTSYFGNISN